MPLTNGSRSGFRRPKNIRTRRIRNTASHYCAVLLRSSMFSGWQPRVRGPHRTPPLGLARKFKVQETTGIIGIRENHRKVQDMSYLFLQFQGVVGLCRHTKIVLCVYAEYRCTSSTDQQIHCLSHPSPFHHLSAKLHYHHFCNFLRKPQSSHRLLPFPNWQRCSQRQVRKKEDYSFCCDTIPLNCFLTDIISTIPMFVKGTVAPDQIGLKAVWLDRPWWV